MKTALPGGHLLSGHLPLYARPVPLDPARHGDRAIRPDAAPFGFAGAAPTIPLTIDEFERAMLDYPIVFFGPARQAMAVTGLNAGRNLFVAEDGRYAPGAYIPGYLRRYPFVTAAIHTTQAVVCLDEAATCLVDRDMPGAVALFESGRPSAMLDEAVTLVQAYAEAEARTAAVAAMLDEFNLFEPRQAHFTATDGDPELLLDYVAVSRARLDALSPEHLAELRDAGALAAVYAHLFSAANWDKLPIWAS